MTAQTAFGPDDDSNTSPKAAPNDELRKRIAAALTDATGDRWPAQAFLTEAAHVLDAIQPELDALAALRQVARGYCPACRRGDAAPTVEDWEQQRQRADQAEAALARARNACDQLHRAAVLADRQPHTDRERGIVQAVTRIRAALDTSQHTPAAGPAGGEPKEQP